MSPGGALWGLIAASFLALFGSACDGDGGGTTVVDTPNMCNDACPDSECVFGRCIGGNNGDMGDMGDMGDVTPDMTPDDGTPDVPDKTCAEDNDCEATEYCLIPGNNEEGVCTEGCREGGCPDGEVCDLGSRACVDGCATDEGCPDGEICEFEDGATVGACVEGCREDDDCDEGELCIQGQCEENTCAEDSDCPQGLVCLNDACVAQPCAEDADCDDPSQYCAEGACATGCRGDSSCAPGEVCDEETRACVEGCREDVDCAPTEYCDQDSSACVEGCRDDSACPQGQSCVSAEGGRACAPTPCAADGECEEGFYCDTDAGACAEGCREGACPPGEACDVETRVCGAAPCEESGDCLDGQYCDEGACVAGCDGDDRCAEGQPCDLATNTCGCGDNEDCGPGQVCTPDGCVAACDEDSDCEDNEYCDEDTQTCVVGCRDDELEPNDTRQNSFPIDAGMYTLRMCYDAQLGVNDEDCFSTSLNEGDEITVSLAVGGLDLDLNLYDPAGTRVRQGSNAQGDESVTYMAAAAGVHVYCVVPQGDAFEGGYGLDVAVEAAVACLADVDEAGGNDACAQVQDNALAIGVGETETLAARTICAGDNDFFAVDMRAGQELEVVLSAVGGPLELEIVNLNCGAVLARGVPEGDDLVATLMAPDSGNYTVRVYGSLANAEAEYQLELTLSAGNAQCPEDVIEAVPVEPNESQEQASILRFTRQQVYEVSSLALCRGDEDWYQLNITTPGDVIRATLVQGVNEIPLSVQIRNSAGGVLDTANEQAMMKTAETTPLAQGGLYYVRVSAPEELPVAGVVYQLRVLVTPGSDCIADEFEPNNDFQSAAMVDDGDHQAVMCRGDDAEVDWYRVMLFPNDRINISVSYDHNEDFMLTSVYRPGADPTQFSDIFLFPGGNPNTDELANGTILVGPNQSGEWLIKVEKGQAGDPLEYVLGIDIQRAECEDTLEAQPNESCGQARAIQLEGNGIDGRVCGPTSDEDWYSVTVAANQQLVVDLEYLHFQDGNLDMEVYAPGGNNVIAEVSYNSGPNCEQVLINPTASGNYCIRVFVTSPLNQTPYRNLKAYIGQPDFTCNP
jgi:hypothetical protein